MLFQLKQNSLYKHRSPGRVSAVNRTNYEVVSEHGLLLCELTGNLLYGKPSFELPCTGDWVIFQSFDEDKGLIVDILPRVHTLYRRKSGTVSDKQAMAAHVDKAFIVQSLDANFNVRRIERFMVQVLEERIQPILIFTKSDLEFSRHQVDQSLEHLSLQMPVFFTSIHSPETLLPVRKSVAQGQTAIFVGFSGVGKSSIINALCEREVFTTSETSRSSGKGRHTSTRREMVLSLFNFHQSISYGLSWLFAIRKEKSHGHRPSFSALLISHAPEFSQEACKMLYQPAYSAQSQASRFDDG
ncbi:ribosome small subunit-dependent GTPase A [Pedobacter africanus]|uniref:Ribosome small subunit-dependent GTPase A n=2 Tax=Pedobacter africanus TaxID=151894 RepID=A0A1W1Z926_9SPHI|nr:ribosome small subunit-dependent GTPase A [Pedobacter africanus]